MSRRTAKLTKRLRSENLETGSTFGGVSLPPTSGGDVSAARMPSPLVPARRFTRLEPGLPRVDECAGSMSSEDKNDVFSRSAAVLVIVRKESIRSFSWVFGVPLRSRIFHRSLVRCVRMK